MSVSEYTAARGGATAVSEQKTSVQSDKDDKADEGLDEIPTSRFETVDITEKDRGYGDQPLVTLTSTLHQAKEDRGKYDDFAMLLRRKIDKEGDAISTTLEIQSPVIRKALKSILATYSYLNLEARPITIKKPYNALFHYRQEIRDYAKSETRTDEERTHMEVLVDFMKLHIGQTERLYDQMVPKGMITFKMLWTLFRAEDDVVFQTDHFQECFRVIHGEEKTKDGVRVFQVEAWRWGYNGAKFGPVQEFIKIPEFSAERSITQLIVFPVHRLPPDYQSRLYADLIQRGRDWRTYVDINHQHYDGPIWVDPPFEPAKNMAELVMAYGSGRIMLDHQRHEQSNYRLATSLIGANGLMRPKINAGPFDYDATPETRHRGSVSTMGCYENTPEYVLTDEQALLCPARTRGFTLGSKKWAFFLVDKIKKITWRDNAFDKVEMEPRLKTAIRAQVAMHGSTTVKFDDFVADKGRGLVMLLFGPPGSGKTLTAESVAEYAHKPLYVIGTGELGTDVAYAEPHLRRIFDVAKSWDAVLLLDEADLFLSKRTRDDMRRNAFVTIFLRLLEYYQGILFLTTNRVEEFDPAFASRIHLKVEYAALNAGKRACIWKNLLEQLDDCCDWDASVYQRLADDFEINGREIKNLIKPALAIATYEKKPLSEDVLRLVFSINYGAKVPSIDGFQTMTSPTSSILFGENLNLR